MTAVKAELSLDELIQVVSDRISSITGVKLGPKQYTLVKSRLTKRLRELGGFSPNKYMQFLRNNEGTEIAALVSLLTTHHSYFFREFPHFEFLAKSGLKQIVKEVKAQGRNKISIWSAACSRGQEVYSLSMFLNYHLPLIDPSMEYEIFGSDVSQDCIDISNNGVYKWKEIKTIPAVYLGRHWSRGTGEISDFVKVNASIKKSTRFAVLNLLNFQNYIGDYKFDLIFCRNVFIYFEQAQINKIVGNFLKYLQPHGEVYLGLSESLMAQGLSVSHIGHSIYVNEDYVRRRNIEVVPEYADPHVQPQFSVDPSDPVLSPDKEPDFSTLDRAIRVMAVDDSPTVLKLIERILSKSPDFELVGTAKDGLDAAQKIKTLKPDVMTLDIHMPNQSGLDYLRTNSSPHHPPVVMVSSVSREDANLALKCFEHGAFDYIEKPSLQNLPLLEDELCTKLLSAYEMRHAKKAQVLDLDRSFQKSPIINNPNQKLRVVYAHVGQREVLYSLLKQFKAPQPPTVVFFEGIGNLVDSIKNEFSKHTVRVEELEDRMLSTLEVNRIYFADAGVMHDSLLSAQSPEQVSILMLGKSSQTTINRAMKWRKAHIIIEDLSMFSKMETQKLKFADEVVPLTSFSYESDKCLSEEGEESAA